MDRHRRHVINLIASVVVIIICVIILIVSFEIKMRLEHELPASSGTDYDSSYDDNNNSNNNTGDDTNTPPSDPTPPTETPDTRFIDLQPTVDQWLSTLSTSEQVGLMIYDLNNSRTAASYRANEVFDVASVYKLLFAYDGYRQITLGTDNPDDILVKTSDKGELTISKCLDLIIRESYNGCADVMNKDTRRAARVNSLIRELGMSSTTNLGLRSTAANLTKLLRAYWRHSDLSSDSWNQLSDSLLNQPPTPSVDNPSEIYDWRQGLPAGFSDSVKVYDKVGWDWNGTYWNTYADAAILDFTNLGRTYTMVVLAKDLSNYNKFTQLGQMIESAVTTAAQGIIK